MVLARCCRMLCVVDVMVLLVDVCWALWLFDVVVVCCRHVLCVAALRRIRVILVVRSVPEEITNIFFRQLEIFFILFIHPRRSLWEPTATTNTTTQQVTSSRIEKQKVREK